MSTFGLPVKNRYDTVQTDRFPDEYMGADKKIRFIIKKGDLYSYLADGRSE